MKKIEIKFKKERSNVFKTYKKKEKKKQGKIVKKDLQIDRQKERK